MHACSANIYILYQCTLLYYYKYYAQYQKFQHAIDSLHNIQNRLKDKTVTRYCSEWLDMIAVVIFVKFTSQQENTNQTFW